MSNSFGAKLSPYDVRDYKLEVTGSIALKKEYERPLVSVKNQGSVNSCVACALSSVTEHFNSLQEDDDRSFSYSFIYGYRPDGYYDGEGMIIREAVKTIKNVGVVEIKDFHKPATEVPNITKAVMSKIDTLQPLAKPNRVSRYFKLTTDDSIKIALFNFGYVIMSVNWYSDLKVDKNGIMRSEKVGTPSRHCIVVYGWNEDGFKILNSWGAKWGKNGTAILPYDYGYNEAWGFDDNIQGELPVIIDEPKRNTILDYIYKIVNWVVNLFRKEE